MKNKHRYWPMLLVILPLFPAVCGAADDNGPGSAKRDLRDIVGVTHVNGAYHLTGKDFLNEGADQILALGSRVIKLYLVPPPSGNCSARAYPFNAEWPQANTLVDVARTPYFRSVFDKPFTTYLLTVYAAGRTEHYWRKGISDAQADDERQQLYRLARHLLTTYRGTGKTFVLQHWEGDWAIRSRTDPNVDPTPTAIDGMVRWLGARQAGVERARAEVGQHGVRVFHAAEVNLVKIAMADDRPTVTNRVLPRTRLDLVSYSAWDTQEDAKVFQAALDYLARHMPDRAPFGGRNVYVGEFGLPENERPAAQVQRTIRNVVSTAVDWGCPYVVYWQVYCNEPRRRPVKRNTDVRGFWLLRPDGTKAPAWHELDRLLNP